MPQKIDNQLKDLIGYTGKAAILLRDTRAKNGSKVTIRTKDGFELSGLLIPRYEGGAGDCIVLKLKSGYNVGIEASSISSLNVEEPPFSEKAPIEEGESVLGTLAGKKTVLLLSTGGTIASKVDYRTGAVKPAYTAADLYASIPELGKIAQIEAEVLFSSLSENLSQRDWEELSERIIASKTKPDSSDLAGIVVMLGTDTLAYVSAALSFSLIGFDHPVVCVGSQRSSDRPSADSALNLQGATRFAASSNMQGVFVAMHKSENDYVIAIHSGVRVRKNHTSRRDAFESIDVPLFAEVRNDKIFLNADFPTISKKSEKRSSTDFSLKTRFDPHVSLIKFYPGFDTGLLDFLVNDRRVKGVIIEGTGLGHVSSKTVEKISELVQKGIFFGITSQCIRGHVDLNVYETGIDLINAGATPLGNMLSETAFVKLSWVLGNFPPNRTISFMTENLIGEMTDRIRLRTN